MAWLLNRLRPPKTMPSVVMSGEKLPPLTEAQKRAKAAFRRADLVDLSQIEVADNQVVDEIELASDLRSS